MADGNDEDLESIDPNAPPQTWPAQSGPPPPQAWPPPSPWPPSTPPSTNPWSPPPPPGSTSSGLPVGVIVGVVALMLVAGLVAFAITYNADSSSNMSTSPPTTSSGGSTGQPPARAVAPLGEVSLQQADVPSGVVVGLITDGNRTSRPTLDLCNGTFPSEAQRVARWQVASFDADGAPPISTEAVLYRNAGNSQQAFAELRAVAARCPNKPVASPVGERTATTKFHAPPDTKWGHTPTVDRLAYDITTTDLQGQTTRSVVVYLRRGRLLMGVYFLDPSGAQTSVAGKTSIPDIVRVFESRIAKLSASDVNGTAA